MSPRSVKTALNIMKVSLRVMTALSKKQQPDSVDVETLRRYLGTRGPSDLDELAREVMQKALIARAKARGAASSGS